MRLIVHYQVTFECDIEVDDPNNEDAIEDALSNINIPEDENSSYVSDSCHTLLVYDEEGKIYVENLY